MTTTERPISPLAGQDHQRLLHLLDRAKVLVTVGSGGVGKTTTAASLAIAAARMGRRTAVLTIDPARRLAQALGIDHLGNEATPLAKELVEPGSVDAMMLETGAAFDDLIARLVPDPERKERLLANRLYQVIARHLGGTHEYMAVEKLFALTREGAYDLVVLDTPPSVNALDFLDAPQRLIHFFSEKITRFFIRRNEESKKGLIARLRDRAGEIAISILSKAFGDTFVEEVQDFSTAFQGLFAAFRERGLVIDALLKSEATSFLVISAADPVRVAEAVDFSDALARLQIEPAAFVMNRVQITQSEEDAPLSADEVRDALASLGVAGDADTEQLRHALEEARQIRRGMAQRDMAGVEELAQRKGKDRVLIIPELAAEVQDRSAVEHMLGALGAEMRLPKT